MDQSVHHHLTNGTSIQGEHVIVHVASATVPAAIRRVVLLWDQIHRGARSAVTATGVADAAETLRRHRILLLAADPDEGASTARLCIAHRLATMLDREPPVEQLALDNEEETLAAAAQDWDTSRLAMVDAMTMPAAARAALIDDVAAAKAMVDATDSFLLVTVPRTDLAAARQRYPDWVTVLGKPDGTAVFRQHLAGRLDAPLLDSVLAEPWFLDQVRDAWPAHAARIADLVGQAAERTGSVAALRVEVRAALADWTEQLRTEVDEATDARTRSLLFAAALIEGGPPAAVVALAGALVSGSRYHEAEPPPHPLVAPSVVTRVAQLGHVTATPNSVVFTRPEYGRAVLPYVWSEHPDLRSSLRNWLQELPREPGLTADVLARAVDRVAELAAVHGLELVSTCTRGWIARDGRTLAERLLSTAATDPRIGREVRRQLWIWSKSAGPDLQHSVATVCGVYGEIYPANALTRLKHLAASAADVVRAAVVDSVAAIAPHIGPYRLLGHLLDWLELPDPTRADTLVRAVRAALALDPVRAALRDGAVRHVGPHSTPVRFWQYALDRLPYEAVTRLVSTWLNAVDDMPQEPTDLLIEQLVTAADRDRHRLVQLSWGARGSAHSPAAEQLMQRILTRLDEPSFDATPEATR
ncbi:hypothetical protein AB0I55_21225 [Actinocatenispora sera]|uniref:hypothetical protein n=1 Tax=Actinocatenispora sera TaxID=390989 RepID=UPI0033ECF02F